LTPASGISFLLTTLQKHTKSEANIVIFLRQMEGETWRPLALLRAFTVI
jgi:hypothetical protein